MRFVFFLLCMASLIFYTSVPNYILLFRKSNMISLVISSFMIHCERIHFTVNLVYISIGFINLIIPILFVYSSEFENRRPLWKPVYLSTMLSYVIMCINQVIIIIAIKTYLHADCTYLKKTIGFSKAVKFNSYHKLPICMYQFVPSCIIRLWIELLTIY